MQLYAKKTPKTSPKETTGILISDLLSADQAKRQCDYFCPECGEVVRLRAGEQRLKHFYHLAKSTHCRQQNKSLEHIQTQRIIQARIGMSLCLLEVSFPLINRIADVVWEEEKLIFEVQCSPMTASEARARIADYGRAGYTVVFILHDKRFNQYRLSALEAALRNTPHYFSDISAHGIGMLYDQFDHINRGCRVKRFAKLPIQIDQPMRLNLKELDHKSCKDFHVLFEQRFLYAIAHMQERGLLYFQGDLFSTAQSDPDSRYIIEALQVKSDSACTASKTVAVDGDIDVAKDNKKWIKLSKWFCSVVRESKQMIRNLSSLLWRHLLEKSGS